MITDCEFYYWSTEEQHTDNTFTMNDFLNVELGEDSCYEVDVTDGTYAEIVEVDFPNHRWAVHAFGNGDSRNHQVQFVPMGDDNDITNSQPTKG